MKSAIETNFEWETLVQNVSLKQAQDFVVEDIKNDVFDDKDKYHLEVMIEVLKIARNFRDGHVGTLGYNQIVYYKVEESA